MKQLHQQVILDYANARIGERVLESPDGWSFQVNPTCGDECTVGVCLEGSLVTEVSWQGRGCSISRASLAMMSEMVEGLTLQHAEDLGEAFRSLMRSRGKDPDPDDVAKLEELIAFQGVARFPARIKCGLLGWIALRDALLKSQYDPGD